MELSASTQQGINALSWSYGRALPVVLQSETAECALACLTMVAGYYGDKTGLAQLRRDFPTSAQGTTLKQLIDIASAIHLAGRALKLDTDALKDLQMPCILHWEMKHFVVLKSVKASSIVIHDPAFGERKVPWNAVNDKFTGVALELSPTAEFQPRKASPALGLLHFWRRIVGLKRSLLLVLLLSFMLQIFVVASPHYMQTVVDEVLLRSDMNLLKVLAIGFSLLLIIEVVSTAIRQHLLLALSSKLNIQMASNVFHHLIRLPLTYFNRRHMGDIVSRFGSLNEVRELLTHGLVTVLVDGLMALVTLLVMGFYSLKLALIVLAIVVLYGLIRYLFFLPFKRMNEERILAAAKENSHFMESVRAIQMIKLFEKEPDRHGQWQSLLVNVINQDIRIGRLADIVFTEKDPYPAHALAVKSTCHEDTVITGAMQVNNLTFSYSQADAPVFKNVSATIEAGTNIAICGPSGAGKTTLLKCLMGLFPVNKGQVLIDGKSIETTAGYRSQIAAVMQNDQLLSGTIADNITGFDNHTNIERVIFAANLACIHNEIMHMPTQYNALLGDMGDNLSGGQRQRLILARALYKKPRILFMDEATSHLDSRNEKLINQHIRNLSITRITVAHRQETLRSADRIFELSPQGLTEIMDQTKPHL